MPQLQYAASQGMIDTRPVQYNVAPNLSGAKAFENLQKALQGAAQLGAQIGQDNFQEEARNLELKVAQNKEAWAGMSYKERKNSMSALQSELVDKYGEDTYYGRQLRNAGSKAFAAFGAELQAQGVKEEYLDNLTSQNRGILQFATDWTNAPNQTERNLLLTKFKDNFVTPYEGFDDEYSRELYNNGLKSLANYQQAYAKVGVAEADTDTLGTVLDSAATAVQMYGTVDAKLYGEMVGKLSQISNFAENKTKYLADLGNKIILGIVNTANEAPRTWENALNFEKKLTDFAKVDPRVTETDTYKAAMTSVRGFKNTVNVQDISSLNALVNNDRAKPADVSMLASSLVARGAITQEVADNMNFLKSERMINKNVTAEASDYYVAGDTESLLELHNRGKGATVKTVITSNLSTELATLAEKGDPMEALNTILKKRQEYIDMGFDVGNLDAVDQILSMPANGGLTSPEAVDTFLATMQASIANNYQATSVKQNMADYVILKGWKAMGVQDIPTQYQGYLTGKSVRVPITDSLAVLDEIIDQYDYTSENVGSANYQQLKSALIKPIEAALKSGISMDKLESSWEEVVEADYININSFWGWGGRTLLPKHGGINSEARYKKVAEHFGTDSTVLPVDILSPSGKWMVLPADGGEPQLYDFEYMEFISMVGQAPTDEQLAKAKARGTK